MTIKLQERSQSAVVIQIKEKRFTGILSFEEENIGSKNLKVPIAHLQFYENVNFSHLYYVVVFNSTAT